MAARLRRAAGQPAFVRPGWRHDPSPKNDGCCARSHSYSRHRPWANAAASRSSNAAATNRDATTATRVDPSLATIARTLAMEWSALGLGPGETAVVDRAGSRYEAGAGRADHRDRRLAVRRAPLLAAARRAVSTSRTLAIALVFLPHPRREASVHLSRRRRPQRRQMRNEYHRRRVWEPFSDKRRVCSITAAI
jgi:hypothetical protein